MTGFRAVEDRVALIKMETTYATDPSPVAVNAVLLMNSSVSLTASKLDRKLDLPYFGGDPFVFVGKQVDLEGECELIGSATAGNAAPIGTLLRTCGHAQTLDPGVDATYNPISRSLESATVYFYWAGILFKLKGARGTIDREIGIKQYGKGKAKITGILVLPSEAEAPSGIDLSAFQSPIATETESWAVTVNGVSVNAYNLTLSQGAEVKMIEGSESRSVQHTDRKPSGLLRIYRDLALSSFNPWTIADALAPVPIISTLVPSGGAAGKSYVLTVNAQLEYAKPSDVDGIACLDIPYVAVPTAAGNDEYTDVFA